MKPINPNQTSGTSHPNPIDLSARAALGVSAEMALSADVCATRQRAESTEESTIWKRYLGFLSGEGLSDRDRGDALDFEDFGEPFGSRRMFSLAVATLLGAAALLLLWVWLVASSHRSEVPTLDPKAGSAAEVVVETEKVNELSLT